MNRFIEAFRNLFRIPDLRNRVLFTLALLAVYRIGAHIPTPGINWRVLELLFQQGQGSFLGIFDLFSGGNLRRLTIFALGIMPYITASIILQLMTVVFPYLEKLQKEGELGRRKITQYTRYLTIVLSVIQSVTIATALQTTNYSGQALVYHPGPGFIFMTILTLTTGSAFIMWLGEQISERGIGNGMSLIIFVGIVVGLPRAILDLYEKYKTQWLGVFTPLALILLIVLMIAAVAFIVFVEGAQRRIPVQYAKRVVGRKVYGGQSTYLPLRVNTGGVIPVIFASSVVTVPTVISGFIQNEGVQRIANYVAYGQPIYYLLQVITIVFFSYFYVSIIFNPADLAENMRKYGGFIPGIRPGKRTEEYIDRILTRLTLVGSLYLAAVSILPEFLLTGVHFRNAAIADFLTRANLDWITTGMGINFYCGGTSLLIVVGVAMDTIQQIESQLVMRNYEGFMKKGRIRGRRG